MYNEDLKRRFLQDYQESKSISNFGERVFNSLEPFESKCSCDFCAMTLDVAKESISGLFGVRAGSAFGKVSILRTYIQWCIDNNIPNVNAELLSLKREGHATVYSQTVKDPVDLQRFLDVSFDDERIQTSDCLVRVYLWLAFSGMEDDEAIEVTTDDINIKDMCVTYNGREYELYDESLNAIRACLRPTFNRYGRNNLTPRERVASKKLLRGIRSDANMSQIRNVLVRGNKAAFDNKKTEKRLSYFRVWLSGVFYRMYLWEQSGNVVDFTDVAESHMSHGESQNLYSFKKPEERRYKLRQLKRNFSIDYERWKESYDL